MSVVPYLFYKLPLPETVSIYNYSRGKLLYPSTKYEMIRVMHQKSIFTSYLFKRGLKISYHIIVPKGTSQALLCKLSKVNQFRKLRQILFDIRAENSNLAKNLIEKINHAMYQDKIPHRGFLSLQNYQN